MKRIALVLAATLVVFGAIAIVASASGEPAFACCDNNN